MTDINQEPNEETTSLVEILLRYVRYWKWFVLGIIVALASLFVYLRYTTPIYKVSASIVLKEAGKQSSQPIIGGMESIQLGALGAVSNIDNEIYILQSRSIIRNVVNRLNLHTSYIVEGRIKSTDLYNSSPVEVSMSQEQLNSLQNDIEFRMTTNSDNSRVRVSGIIGGAQIDTLFTTLPAQLHTAQGNISFTEREGASPRESNLLVTIQHPNAVIGHYRSNLTIQQASKQASVLDLSLNTAYPKKGEDFLNTLVEVYNNETIEDNKMEAFNTQAFINERIVIIDKELSDADQEVEVYKQSEGLSDLQVDLQRNMQMGSQYEQQLVQVETQLNIVNSLGQVYQTPQQLSPHQNR